MTDPSEDASYRRESWDEGTILAPDFDGDHDLHMRDLRREMDNTVIWYERQIDEAEKDAARLREMRDAMILRYETRIGDVAADAERHGLAD